MDQYTDSQILEGIRNSDGKVVDFIYRSYYGRVESFLLGKGGNPEHIRDVFQEAMYIIHRNVKQRNLTLSSSFSTYLFAVCKNVWMQDLRKYRYRPVEDGSLDILTDEPEEDHEMRDRLIELFRRHLGQLSEDCIKLLEMHFNNVPISEIQEAFGYSSEHYTSDKKYRCKQSLYRRIINDPEYKKILKDG